MEYNKVILGTTIKKVNKAKVYGTLEMKELLLIKIISDLKDFYSSALDFEHIKKLDKLSRDIQNKYTYICKYKKSNFKNKKFIK